MRAFLTLYYKFIKNQEIPFIYNCMGIQYIYILVKSDNKIVIFTVRVYTCEGLYDIIELDKFEFVEE